ncbi:TadE family type IV pilus minor pilin [Kitasatospora sp. NPDC051914]|uniref:TadE family type IV pilus minor pilin n=1 Tax=Kitasatospora sp. NPDC051914 TaxID=3154945 RepID=UPI003435C457
MATAETAVALPAMVVLAAMLVWAVLATAGEVRCVDAARVGARAAARGDTDAEALARAAAPPGARVEVAQGTETVRVTVEVPLPAPGKLGAAVAVRLRASAVAAREDVAGLEESGAPWPS